MGRDAWEPSSKDLKFIQKMYSKGADQKTIYKGLKIGASTWRKYKLGLDQNGNIKNTINNKNNTPIKKALEAGLEDRRKLIYNAAEDSLLKQIKGYYVEEEDRVVKIDKLEDEDGNVVREVEDIQRVIRKKKFISPNSTITMFALVNNGDGLYQSINKVEVKQENHNQNGKPVKRVFKVE